MKFLDMGKGKPKKFKTVDIKNLELPTINAQLPNLIDKVASIKPDDKTSPHIFYFNVIRPWTWKWIKFKIELWWDEINGKVWY